MVDRNDDGVFVSGVKMQQTGCVNSHWFIVILTMRLSVDDKDFTIVGTIPAHADEIAYTYGRQFSDIRSMGASSIDAGNVEFGGQEAMILLDQVFIPTTVFSWMVNMNLHPHGQALHYLSPVKLYMYNWYVLIGATAQIVDLNGVAKVSHIKDKLVKMAHLKETIRSSSLALASACEGRKMKSDMQMIESIQANVCKQNVTRFPYEIARLVQDLTGGLLVTMSPELELKHSDVGPLIRKFIVGNDDADIDRIKVLRLTKNITLGLNAVGYLTEPMHAAGSPQAQRIQIVRGMDLDTKRIYAHKISRITET